MKQSTEKRQRTVSAQGRLCIAGALDLLTLTGMSAGTVLLAAFGGTSAQAETGLLVAGGLTVMLGCAVWLLRALPEQKEKGDKR